MVDRLHNSRSRLKTYIRRENGSLDQLHDKCKQDVHLAIVTGMNESFMVLNRNYSIDTNGQIEDLTTYIDPVKFNYIFADTNLDAMNFWVQTKFDIKVRRLISAKQIPNL